MLKILQARLQQCINQELPDVQAGFRKGRGPEIKLPTFGSQKKVREFQNIYFCFTDYTKAFDCGLKQTGKFLKRWEYQVTLPAFCEACVQVKKQQLEPDMEQWTGSKLGKEYIKAVYCHPAHLIYMQSTSCKTLD